MDAQLKRGMTEALVLSLLSRGDSYGYELISRAQDVLPLSESSLYPVLRRLEGLGAVVSYTRESGGRLRRYYRRGTGADKMIESFKEDWETLEKVYAFIIKNEQRGDEND